MISLARALRKSSPHRLLRLEDDGEFSLVEFFGKSTPRYAVLSHTWGADNQEVTYKDLVDGAGKSKAGYSKIRFCGKQAAKDGLQFFWVDTCCIDKSSSAELSEAINSMFQWYHKADKCYVYLSDVSVGGSVGNDLSSQRIWKPDFRDSGWFTRGWTLQELLAPKLVEFFSTEGEQLGDKISLVQEIHDATGISVQALQGSPLSQFSVDERMLWAEGRETKREEDAAYSLLGIFDIHMPLLYGEGREKAFARLRKEIEPSVQMQKEDKECIQHLRLTKPSPSSTVPFRRDDDFISRESLTTIRQICARPASRAALVGLGGVGKSQIAIEYAYQVRDESPTTWVFWVHAGTQARFEEGYRRIAEATKMDDWDNPKADVLRLVRSWLCNEGNGQWVMVVDNADNSDVFFPPFHRTQAVGTTNSGQAVEPLSDFLPQSPNGSILVTSRSQDVAYRLTGSHRSIIEVKPMDEDDALALLQKKLSFHANRGDAIKLLQALDRMPLAITQAAAYIAQRAPRMTVSRYVDEVRRSDHDRARLLKKDVGDSRRDGRASNSIIATWQISFEHMRREMPTAARLLSLMSLFDRQGIPELLLRDRYRRDDDREDDFEDDIHTLTSYSLVEISSDGKEFEMHRLVQFSTKKWLELNQELEEWKETYVTLMDDSYPVGRHENWEVCQALFPHAEAAVGYRPADVKALEAWASVLFKAAWYASEMGNYQAAEEMDQGALEAREAVLGAEHSDTLNSINNLGLVLESQGRYEEAEAMHQQALKAREKVLGREHPDTLTSISNLGSVLSSQGKYEEAEAMHRRDLEGSKKVLGQEHPDTLTSISNLGLVLSRQGKYEEAEVIHQRALEAREKVLGREHPDTLTSVSNLGSVLSRQGKYKEAEAKHQWALEGYEKVLGREHPDTLTSVSNLGSVLSSQGKYEEAEAMHQRALEGYEKVLGQQHPDTLTSVSNLGSALDSQDKYEEAKAMHQRALEGYEKVLGREHPHTLTSVSNLGLVLGSQGKYEEAEAMHQRALEGYEKVLGREHPHTLTSVSNLGLVLDSQGKRGEAPEGNPGVPPPPPAAAPVLMPAPPPPPPPRDTMRGNLVLERLEKLLLGKQEEAEDSQFSRLEQLLIEQQQARVENEKAKKKATEEVAIRAAEAKKQGDEDKLAKLEKLILAQKDEQLKREAAAEAARQVEKTAKAGKEAEETKAAHEKALAEAKATAEELEKAKKTTEEKAAIMKPSDAPKPPIKFKDAVGRKFSFPWHLCRTWEGMEDLIKQAFLHVNVIGPHVHEGHYDLVGPDGEIILPQIWETMVRPDWVITMHMWPMPEPPPPEPPKEVLPQPPPEHIVMPSLAKSKVKSKSKKRNSHAMALLPPPPPPPPPPLPAVISVVPAESHTSRRKGRMGPSPFMRWVGRGASQSQSLRRKKA